MVTTHGRQGDGIQRMISTLHTLRVVCSVALYVGLQDISLCFSTYVGLQDISLCFSTYVGLGGGTRERRY